MDEVCLTKRLRIREASLSDAEFIYDLLNSPTWIEHIGNRKIHDLEDARNYIQSALLDSYKSNGFGLYVIELLDNRMAIGLCGFLKRVDLPHVDIGFAILPEYAGNGYTYEAANTLVKQADFPVIYGITYDGNIASKRLLEKLGLRHIKNFQFGDYEEESMLYSNEG